MTYARSNQGYRMVIFVTMTKVRETDGATYGFTVYTNVFGTPKPPQGSVMRFTCTLHHLDILSLPCLSSECLRPRASRTPAPTAATDHATNSI